MKISINSYGNYSNNYGTNSIKLIIGSLTLYFSYWTVVAFEDHNNGLKVVQNQWGSTTGKHLNFIDGGNKSARLSKKEFDEALEKTLIKYNLEI